MLQNIKFKSSSKEAEKTYCDGLIGGTAWFFSRENMEGKFERRDFNG